MKKFKEKMMYVLPVATIAGGSMVSLAQDVTANSALVSGATSAVNQVTANINAVIPLSLSVLGLVMAIKIGVRVFRSLTNTSAGR